MTCNGIQTLRPPNPEGLLASPILCFFRKNAQDESHERAYLASVASVEGVRDEEIGRLKRLADEERKRLIKEEVTIRGFEKALQRNVGCSHTRTKAWGDKYGSGLRYSEIWSEGMGVRMEAKTGEGEWAWGRSGLQ